MEEILNKLINIVMETTPELWEIAYNQVSVKLYQYIFVSAMCIVPIVLFFIFLKRLTKDKYGSYTDETLVPVVISGIIGGVSLLVLLYNIVIVIGMIANPKYYAIQVLLNMMK